MVRATGIVLVLAAVAVVAALALPEAAPESTGIGAAINRTANVLGAANQSAYLIFYPNLTGAYADYHRAVNLSKNASNDSAVYYLLNRSTSAAELEIARIESYAGISLAVLAAFGIAVGAILYRFMSRSGK